MWSQAVTLLIANPNDHQLDIWKNQVKDYFHYQPLLKSFILPSGNFNDTGLPTKTTCVFSIFLRKDLVKLIENHYEIASKLFEKYKHNFAKDNYDLRCAANTQHVLDVGDYSPICSFPRCCSPVEELVIMEELNKLLDSSMNFPSSSQ